MEEEIIQFILNEGLSPFNKEKSGRGYASQTFKTKDAKAVLTKVLTKLSSEFNFADSSCIWNALPLGASRGEIEKRQKFFRNLPNDEGLWIKRITKPRAIWKPDYSIIVVTEDEKAFLCLKELGCPVRFLITEEDVRALEEYDIIQAVECEKFSAMLEQLPQSVFLDSADEAYLERYLEALSGWKDNLEIILENSQLQDMKTLASELRPLIAIVEKKGKKKLSHEDLQEELEKINEEIAFKLKGMTLQGDSILSLLNKTNLPSELQKIVNEAISGSIVPKHVFNMSIPLTFDEAELDRLIKIESASANTSVAETIKKNADLIKKSPEKTRRLEALLLLSDFIAGMMKFIKECEGWPEINEEFEMKDSRNIFLEKPQPVSFKLDQGIQCSILTGANSGGKTTLLEHVLQLVVLSQLGLSIKGNVKMPLFTEVYYFAKNKGSANKGAFETLLHQMAEIKPGKNTLILADEIESVTEPGVAGLILAASAEYFIRMNSYVIIATHLGQEVQKRLPQKARIDGISAKGLDENFELIIDHAPVMGQLANSTPELIVEKLANTKKEEYFNYLYQYLKSFKKG